MVLTGQCGSLIHGKGRERVLRYHLRRLQHAQQHANRHAFQFSNQRRHQSNLLRGPPLPLSCSNLGSSAATSDVLCRPPQISAQRRASFLNHGPFRPSSAVASIGASANAMVASDRMPLVVEANDADMADSTKRNAMKLLMDSLQGAATSAITTPLDSSKRAHSRAHRTSLLFNINKVVVADQQSRIEPETQAEQVADAATDVESSPAVAKLLSSLPPQAPVSVSTPAQQPVSQSLVCTLPQIDPAEVDHIYHRHQQQETEDAHAQQALSTAGTQQGRAPQHGGLRITSSRLMDEARAAQRDLHEREQNQKLLRELKRCINKKRAEEAMDAFHELIQKDQGGIIGVKVLHDLFLVMARADHPLEALEVLDHHHRHPQSKGLQRPMYIQFCKSISRITPGLMNPDDLEIFSDNLKKHCKQLDAAQREEVYPRLIASLLKQKSMALSAEAALIYQAMVDADSEIKPKWMQHVLVLSKHNRSSQMPFHDIMRRLADSGYLPYPPIVVKAIGDMFPFHHTDKLSIALQALIDLKRLETAGVPQSMQLSQRSSEHPLKIDVGMLETMSASAATKGDADLIELIWQVMDEFECRPNETIYENTVIAFANCKGRGLDMAFSALAAMQLDGFQVPRALLRSISRAIRSNVAVVDVGLRLLQNSDDGEDNPVTIHTVNAVISACAERGDVQRSQRAFHEITRHGLKPNDDTFSFMIEALGKHVRQQKHILADQGRHDHGDWFPQMLESVDTILLDMDAHGIAPSRRIVLEYVTLLCELGEVETATKVVMGTLENDGLVDNRTLYRVAVANAKAGDIALAKQIASHTSEHISGLSRRLENIEKQFNRPFVAEERR